MAKLLEDLIKEYFFDNKEPVKGDAIKDRYRDLLYNLFARTEVIKFKDDTKLNIFKTKASRTRYNFDNYQQRVADVIKDYCTDKIVEDTDLHYTQDEMNLYADLVSLTSISAYPERKIKFTLEEKMEILPKAFTKLDKVKNSINDCLKVVNNFDIKDAEKAKLIKNAEKKVDSLKPNFLTWIFRNHKYHEQKAIYNEAKDLLQTSIKETYMPIFIKEQLGDKVCDTPIKDISTNGAKTMIQELKNEIAELDLEKEQVEIRDIDVQRNLNLNEVNEVEATERIEVDNTPVVEKNMEKEK